MLNERQCDQLQALIDYGRYAKVMPFDKPDFAALVDNDLVTPKLYHDYEDGWVVCWVLTPKGYEALEECADVDSRTV